mgnify:FL=1
MFRFVKHNFMRFASPVDARTVALLLACALAFYMGARFESVATERAKKATISLQLKQSQEANRQLIAAKTERDTLQKKIERIQNESDEFAARADADSARLRARVESERMRATAAAVLKNTTSDPSSTCDDASADAELWDAVGTVVVPLIEEADQMLIGFRECQAYVRAVAE